MSLILFFIFYSTEIWALNIPGTELDGTWVVSESEKSDPLNTKLPTFKTNIPFHKITERSLFINCQYYFDGDYKYLVLPFLSSSGFRIYLNGTLINQTGDIDHGTANVWNHVHLIALDKHLLNTQKNELIIELYSMYTHGIDKAPILTNFDNTYTKVYVQNLFRTYIPFISMGAALILGIILIILGISDKKTRKLFLYLGFCMLLTAIFLYDDRFRISTGTIDFFLILRKLTVSAGFLASWFLTASIELYSTNKTKISKILLVANILAVLFGILQPTFAAHAQWIAVSLIINIINILTATIILVMHIKSREWLLLPIFFMNITFIHYLITWHVLRDIGPNLTDLGLIFGSLGFGLILIVQFRTLLHNNMLMQSKNYELELQKNEALKAAQMKSDIIAQTSHEIRNPLMGILGMSESLLSKALDEQTMDDISVIKSCALNLKEILNNILDNAKIEAGKFELHEETFSINEVINELDAIYSILSKQKQLQWSVYVDEIVPELIKTDKIRITQLLNNLLSNAVKYTDEGKVELTITTEEDTLIFSVADSGAGIKEELQEKIFDPYYQLENSHHIQGTGLGLSIVKKLITMFNGELLLKSTTGKGSTFTVKIPFKVADMVQPPYEYSKKKDFSILIADDNRINLQVLKNYLDDLSIKFISTANNGKEALEKIEKEKFDFIVLDINMPFLTGDKIISKVRNSENQNKKACFIALTGENSSQTSKYLKESGFDIVLKKPVSKKVFLNLFSKNQTENNTREMIKKSISKQIEKAGLDEETTSLIINEFLKETPEQLKMISAAIDKRDMQTIYEKIHYFKSSLDYLGTEKAINLRIILEEAVKNEDYHFIDLYYREFYKELQAIMTLFKNIVERKEHL